MCREDIESPNKRVKLNLITQSLQDMSIDMPPMEDFNEDSNLGFQVAKGIFFAEELEYHALILSQGWPSWAFALDGLGFETISTVASFPSLTSRDEFRSTAIGKSLMNMHSLEAWTSKHEEDGIIFVQGKRSYFEQCMSGVIDWEDRRVIFCCSDSDFFIADGWRESHAEAGGITNGSWTCYSQNVTLSEVNTTIV